MLSPPAAGPSDCSFNPPYVDSHVQIILLHGSPCTDLTMLRPLPRAVYAADPELHHSVHANYTYINVNEPGALPAHEWPSLGLTLWFYREPFERLLGHKEKQYWSTSMVRLLSCSGPPSMPILELIQTLPIHPKHKECSMEKAFQVLTGNIQISVLPSLQPLHLGRFSVILSSPKP